MGTRNVIVQLIIILYHNQVLSYLQQIVLGS